MPSMENNNMKGGKDTFLANQKIGIFIDAENVEMSGYNYYGGRTDYKKLLTQIGGNRQVIRNLYYKPKYKDISEEFKRFWSDQGGEIRQPEKNADPWLIIDAVTLVDKVDVVVIVGGDKDYLPLIWYVKSRGCKAEVWTYKETCSQLIIDAADYFYSIDENSLIKDTKKKKKSRRRKSTKSSSAPETTPAETTARHKQGKEKKEKLQPVKS